MIVELLSGLAAKLGAAGLAAKTGVGLTMAAASVTGAAAADVLPDPVQRAVSGVVADVTPFEFSDGADDHADFGARVSDDARDDQPGVDGSVIADEARRLGQERRGDAGVPEDPAADGLDRARLTPAKEHVPATVPGGGSTPDQYRPVEPPTGAPAEIPAGRPQETPSQAPVDVPGQPEDIPSGEPGDAPAGQPEDIPSGEPEDVPAGQPEDTPSGPPEGIPSGRP